MYDYKKSSFTNMPDIARQTIPQNLEIIDWVGMGNIQLPMLYKEGLIAQQVQASVNAYVNLNEVNTRGIHMSRLYLLIEQMADISPAGFTDTLGAFLQTHKGISSASRIDINFGLMIKRPSLVSDNSGWRLYPCSIDGKLVDGKISYTSTVEVLYSSTCPCSKALAAQLIQNKFKKDFYDKTSIDKGEVSDWLLNNSHGATPHSQRSMAKVTVSGVDAGATCFSLVELINLIEKSLRTPVQAAVKREDEQQFALLNGQTPMFCEDAARTIKKTLHGRYPSYKFQVHHYESLHAHDAVAMGSGGLKDI